MVPIFVMLGRLVCAVVDAWRSDKSMRIPLAVVVSFLVSGMIFFAFVENWSVLDAFYFSATTLTTVGLGAPDSPRRSTSLMRHSAWLASPCCPCSLAPPCCCLPST
jgi:hypothetical protein